MNFIEICTRISNCKSCTLFQLDANDIKFLPNYVGKDVMFIASNPGYVIDKKTKTVFPLKNNNNKQQDEFLEFLNKNEIFRNSYFTNIVKCATYNNKEPDKEHFIKCIKILEQEIKFVNPKYVVLLGKFAQKVFKEYINIDENTEVYSTYHTTYIYSYNRKMIPQFERGLLMGLSNVNTKAKIDKNNFVHFHCHSEYSVRDALSKLSDLIDYAKNNKMKHLCITDHGNISSWARLFKGCRDNNIKPIFGCELYINNFRHINLDDYKNNEEEYNNMKLKYKKYYHLVAIAKNSTGVKNLIKINNDAHVNGFYYKPRTDFEMLKNSSEGLIILSACLGGEIPHFLLNNNEEKAAEIALKYKSVFKDRYYLEVQLHNMKEQIEVNKKIIKLSKKLDIPLIVTNDVHYIRKEDQKAHDLLITIRDRSSKKALSMGQDIQGYHARELYYKTYDEMIQSWEKYHKSEIFNFNVLTECINSVYKIIDQIEDVDFNNNVKLPKLYENEEEVFKKKIKNGVEWRYGKNIDDKIKDRIRYEYSIIRKMKYIGYFLIMEDIAKWVLDKNIVPSPGRGSVGGSLIAYVLGITHIDPIKYNLLFERFLDLGRDKAHFAKLID